MTHDVLARIEVVGLDADDTLWHSENRSHEIHQRYHELLARHADLDPDDLGARILATERRNLRLFGYGAKGFTLSLIETAIEVTDARIPASDIETIISFGKDLLDHHAIDPSTFCMIGNSARSDVLPLLEIGAHAVHVPYEFLWAHEAVPGAEEDDRFPTVTSITDVVDLLPPPPHRTEGP